MELITPGIGLIFWMLVTFTTVLFLMKKFAWKPILGMLKEREDSIEDALKAAADAKLSMAKLKSDNEETLAQARSERDALLKEARETQDMIISEARNKAKEETDKMILAAQVAIQSEKAAAIESMKEQIVSLSIQVSEKILRKELSSETKQSDLVSDLVKDIKLN